MPLTSAVTAPPIENLPDPAGGFEFDVAAAQPDLFVVSLPGAAATGNGVGTYTNTHRYPVRLREVRVHADTAPTTAAGLVVDVNVEGTSVFNPTGLRPKVAQGENDVTAVPSRDGDTRQLVQPGETVTVDVDTASGADVTITVECVEIAPLNREGVLY